MPGKPCYLLIIASLLILLSCGGEESPYAIYGVQTNAGNIFATNVPFGSWTINLKMDMYTPIPVNSSTPWPLIIFLHGGSFRQGSRDNTRIMEFCTDLARRGTATASIDYRLMLYLDNDDKYTDAEIRTAIQVAAYDALAAVRYMKQYNIAWNIDTNNISLAGSSAGAIAVVYAGYNISDPNNNNINSPSQSSDVKGVISIAGGIYQRTELFDYSYPSDISPPSLCLFHGREDIHVPYSCSVLARDEAEKYGIYNELHLYPYHDHVLLHQKAIEIADRITEFIYAVKSSP